MYETLTQCWVTSRLLFWFSLPSASGWVGLSCNEKAGVAQKVGRAQCQKLAKDICYTIQCHAVTAAQELTGYWLASAIALSITCFVYSDYVIICFPFYFFLGFWLVCWGFSSFCIPLNCLYLNPHYLPLFFFPVLSPLCWVQWVSSCVMLSCELDLNYTTKDMNSVLLSTFKLLYQ